MEKKYLRKDGNSMGTKLSDRELFVLYCGILDAKKNKKRIEQG